MAAVCKQNVVSEWDGINRPQASQPGRVCLGAASRDDRVPMSELPADPPIPDELLAAVLRVEDEHLREALETHLVTLPQSMRDLGKLLREDSWVDAMRGVFEMDDTRARLLAAATVAVVAQEMKNAPGEFESWMRGNTD